MFCWQLLESYKIKEKHIEFVRPILLKFICYMSLRKKFWNVGAVFYFMSWPHSLCWYIVTVCPPNPLLKHLSVWESVQETELFIDHCRDLDLLSTIAIIFRFMAQTICCWFKRFSFKNDIYCRWRYRHYNLAGNTAWIDDVKKPITFVHSKVAWFCQ